MKVDWLERNFVFRVSRGVFLFISVIVTIGLFFSAIYMLYTFSPTLKGMGPSKPTPPALASVTASEVASIIEASKKDDAGTPASAFNAGDYAEDVDYEFDEGDDDMPVDPDLLKIAELTTRIHNDYFPGDDFPWLSVYDQVCTYPWGKNCFRWETKLAKEGMADKVDRALKDLPPPEQIRVLQAMLDILAKTPADEEARFSAAWAVSDLTRAYGKAEPAVIAKLLDLMTPKPSEQKDQPPVLRVPDDQRDRLFNTILRIRKRGTDPQKLVAYLDEWPEMNAFFVEDEKLNGMNAAWELAANTPVEQVSETIKSVLALLAGLDPADRAQGVQIYTDLLFSKMAADRASFQAAMSNYQSALAQRDREYESKKGEKRSKRPYAIYSVGVALGSIAVFGLLLAALGIERNTRTLERLIAEMKERSAPPQS